MFLGQHDDHPSGNRQRRGVVRVAGDGAARVRERGGPVRLVEPAAGEAPFAAPGEMGVRRDIVRLQTERLFEQRDGLSGFVGHMGLHVGLSAQKEVIGSEALGTLASRAFDLQPPHAWFDDADDAIGDLVLKVENVLERAVEIVGPEVSPGLGLDELAVIRSRAPALRTLPSST